ncbi:hypothetical protein EZS27_008500 [termite gut metagenome]|uniref:Lipocalin-like domain-containing protein n=1 Tax=termite gut metagenome TaxID=433724 RepID=A0A5J4SEI0_9ZZZZ
MKQVKILWIAAIAVFITACSNDKSEEVIIVDDGAYTGTLVVDQKDGTSYTQEEVSVVVSIDADHAEILMKQVSFSERMPVKLDMTIPDISITTISHGLLLNGNHIIPWAMKGEFPQYTITDLTGEVTTQSISFEMMCGEFPLRFSGVINESD